MILVLIVGLILVICNLLFTWKFNTWSYETWNYNPYYNSNAFSNLIFMNILLHLPGIAGLWMMVAAIILSNEAATNFALEAETSAPS